MAVTPDHNERTRNMYSKPILTGLAALLVVGILAWQAITVGGTPDPTSKGLSPAAMVLSTGVLVFREGLEAILVLAAVTAGMARSGQQNYLRAVPVGGVAAFLATIATWFAVVAIISHVNAPELAIQAATGLLAIVVLLVVMNWFFHKFYWTGWIANHSNRRKRLMEAADVGASGTFWGLALLGFTAIYREGFEIVLFLQDLRLRAGNGVVVQGMAIGLALTLIVAALTFLAHKKLPYKKMLIVTGVLLGGVLLVMVGESVQEMQQAGWMATTSVNLALPSWLGLWFSVFPNVQSLAAQALAAAIVAGSYVAVPYVRGLRPRSPKRAEFVPDMTGHTEMPLSRMRPGEFGHLLSYCSSGDVLEHVRKLGLMPGIEIRVLQVAPLGEPMIVRVGGCQLSLRRREAKAIKMRRCPPEFLSDSDGSARDE